MSKYVYINQKNQVQEIIPEFDTTFPNIPINLRYSQEFLDSCVIVDEGEEPSIGYIYNNEDGSFVEPVVPDPVVPDPVVPEITLEERVSAIEDVILTLI